MATNSTIPLSIAIDRKTVLGSGYYGTVFRGEWNSKKVAVKRIEFEKWENSKGEEALQNLNHPNVVKLYHVESDLDFRYYALELCQASLDQKFLNDKNPRKYSGPTPPEKEVCLQLAKGLAYIHEKKLIHRDLKPENVLIWVDSTGEKILMKWADFGLSKQVNPGGSHSISGVRGTRNWHSPEILKIMTEENDGKTTATSPSIRPRGTVKSDVFSAGLVFGYYLLGGHHPFGSTVNVLPNIFKKEPVNLTKIEEHPMHAIIMDMLKDHPDERISSADVVSRLNNLIKFQYIQRYLGIDSIEDDTIWNELFVPAITMGIAVLSQLMICTSQVTDFKIDQFVVRKHIPLVKHPESFRTTLVQVVNDAYNAFMTAHTNMENIQSEMAQLAVYVMDCVKIIKSDNKVDIEKLVPRRLECIKEAADDGEKLSAEVYDAFELLGQLIQQVLLAIVASQGEKEQEIEAAIKANIEERKQRQEKAMYGQKKNEKEINKIHDEYIESLKNMHIDVEEDISTDKMIQILQDGKKQLGKLQENWVGMTLYFKSINRYIEKVMKKQQNMFVEDAKDAQKETFMIDFMNNSIKKSLESSTKLHRTAAMYVKVSNKYIMELLRNMRGMLAIEPAKMDQAQKELVESCIRASEGIKIMFNEDTAQTIREIENALQSSDPFEVIRNDAE